MRPRSSRFGIPASFIHLEVKEKKLGAKKIRKESMIFPRYHQLDAVRKMIDCAREDGVGHNYLVQHSAGSGKSNSIAWLVHRLATLYNDQDEKIFDSVIVVTDRLVLDQQLQNTIYQFEHKQGVIQKIDEDATQLAQALATGVPIVITTLQKFPFVTEKIGDLPARKYAVIVDEAHSSQGGESATELKGVPAGPTYHFDNEVTLKYYRLQKISEGSIPLQAGDDQPVDGPLAVGTGAAHEVKIELSRLIDIVNERFGTEFTAADQLFLDSIREDAVADSELQQVALANTLENFGYVFRKQLEGLFIDRMDQNEAITAKYMNEKDFQKLVGDYLLQQVYEQIRSEKTVE